ncbi:trypsin-like serine peptidase [Pseudomarimonas arenosa]|uniref:Trypsin-like peptidase domain-containing protein n=1 Tax=Pseudomarimonas arenosa TaxID=2774145 RepID=A0AAW3ZQ94_9GAMM|nr:serine protease [Pseudomarimonas arenosa]MBD8527659.1 trypsin-like peptidase domain-containing protein [Pseudomarimonas arenosa]
MQINSRVIEASERRLQELPHYRACIERLPREMNVRSDFVAKRMAMMQVGGAQPSVTEIERSIGRNDLLDLFYLDRIAIAALAVARISLKRGAATGFMISPSLMLTNWHVFESEDVAREALAGFEYRRNLRGEPQRAVEFSFQPDRYFFARKELDYAVVAVSARSLDDRVPLSRYAYLRLIGQTGKANPGEWATILQHPGGQPLQIAIRENQLIEEPFQGDFLWYLSDTAQGSSGSPVFNDQMQVIALHHSGVARRDGQLYVLQDGRRVPSLDGYSEEEVIWDANEGIRVSALCRDMIANAPRGAAYDELMLAMQGGDLLERAYQGRPPLGAAMTESFSADAARMGERRVVGGIEIPITLTIGVEPVGIAPVGAVRVELAQLAAAGASAPVVDDQAHGQVQVGSARQAAPAKPAARVSAAVDRPPSKRRGRPPKT